MKERKKNIKEYVIFKIIYNFFFFFYTVNKAVKCKNMFEFFHYLSKREEKIIVNDDAFILIKRIFFNLLIACRISPKHMCAVRVRAQLQFFKFSIRLFVKIEALI